MHVATKNHSLQVTLQQIRLTYLLKTPAKCLFHHSALEVYVVLWEHSVMLWLGWTFLVSVASQSDAVCNYCVCPCLMCQYIRDSQIFTLLLVSLCFTSPTPNPLYQNYNHQSPPGPNTLIDIQLFWEVFSRAMQLGIPKQFFGETAITFPLDQRNVLADFLFSLVSFYLNFKWHVFVGAFPTQFICSVGLMPDAFLGNLLLNRLLLGVCPVLSVCDKRIGTKKLCFSVLYCYVQFVTSKVIFVFTECFIKFELEMCDFWHIVIYYYYFQFCDPEKAFCQFTENCEFFLHHLYRCNVYNLLAAVTYKIKDSPSTFWSLNLHRWPFVHKPSANSQIIVIL